MPPHPLSRLTRLRVYVQRATRSRAAVSKPCRATKPHHAAVSASAMAPTTDSHEPMCSEHVPLELHAVNALVAQSGVAAAGPATSDESPGPCHWQSWQLAARPASASAGEEDKVPDIFAWPIPGPGGLQPGRAPGYRYRCAARWVVRVGSACVRLMLC